MIDISKIREGDLLLDEYQADKVMKIFYITLSVYDLQFKAVAISSNCITYPVGKVTWFHRDSVAFKNLKLLSSKEEQ